MMRITVCVVRVQIQEIQSSMIRLEKKLWWQCVDKGAFLLLREVVTSPMRANYKVKVYSPNH